MVYKISKERFEELCNSEMWDTIEEFHSMLEEFTGITAKSYVAYQYFDSTGKYIGNSNEDTVKDLLNNAYIKIENT